jgi:enoyl-CoA hydratase
MPDPRVKLSYDGPVAVITNDNPDKKNAFDDEMDLALFEILTELKGRKDVRAIVWRGEGSAWSSGRDVGAIGGGQVAMTHHELMTRGQWGIQQLWEIEAPVIVAIQGWAIGGSFQRAMLCDIRIAAEGSPRPGTGSSPTPAAWGPCSRWRATAWSATWSSPDGR